MFLEWLYLYHCVTFAEGKTLRCCSAKASGTGDLNAGMPRFIELHRCCTFYKLKATLPQQRDQGSLYYNIALSQQN